MREDEEHCKREFDTFLRQCYRGDDIAWTKGDEPPDYYLTLCGTKYAVEVTRLMEKVTVGSAKPLPYKEISRVLQNFVGNIEILAKKEGSLHGKYLVSFTPINNFTVVCGEIQEALLNFIRQTKNLDNFPWKTIFKSKIRTPRCMPQNCEIQKLDSSSDKVLFCGVSGAVKHESEVVGDLCRLLNDRLDTKKYLLRNIAFPKIVLLLDQYLFADLAEYEACVNQIPSLNFFHTVFVVRGRWNSFLLYSQHTDWAKKQFTITARS